MKKPPKDEKFEIRYVKDHGEIGAGKIIQFVPRDKLVPVMVPQHAPADEHLGMMTINGPSLEEEDIYSGDQVLFRNDITNKDIGSDTICAVFIRSTGELCAKKVAFGNRGDLVTLISSGGGFKDVHYPKDDIEVRGIVWIVQRMANQYGRFRRRSDGIPF